ncbi:mitochondrial import inner membrane translocase subunit TIM22-4 [Silene latifolia]|uniref:mitochondrial import inner membrane translocase subunit TIM22-4 n=1 Tax=Silene latifolia TaxID=37657 RepID=UPI003D76FFFB
MSNNGGAESAATTAAAVVEKPPVEQLHMMTPEEIRGQDIWNNCAVRSVMSGVMGGGLGVMMGIFFAALDNPIMQDTMTTRQQLAYTAKQMGTRSWSNCKTFALMGLMFSASECIIEKWRAKHDSTNSAVAGCVTGGALAAKGGPQAACVGCAGFAAFSIILERFLERHE